MKVAVIGAGYVGLTTAVCLARLDHDVVGYDVDGKKIEALQAGHPQIFEEGLSEAMRDVLRRKLLRFSADVADAVGEAELVFLAVGTPPLSDGGIDLSFIRSACRQIATAMRPNTVVVVKSTVIAGTSERVRQWIRDQRGAGDFHVASNPEFLREGSAMKDFMCPDRIVIGTDNVQAERRLRSLYRPLTEAGAPLLATTTRNAELIKYASNAFLALKIGFINEVASLCEQIDADASIVAKGVGLDRRIGPDFLAPGPGFGGSCFPKDSRAFIATGRKNRAPQHLLETLVRQNEARKAELAQRVIDEAGLKRGQTVAVLGLAFKANTDDIRESAALSMIPLFLEAGLTVRAHDPEAARNARAVLEDVEFVADPYAAVKGARALVILTEWDAYRRLDLARLASLMPGGAVFDYRSLMSARAIADSGLRYFGVGRAPVVPAPAKQGAGAHALLPLDKAAAAVWEPLR